MGGMMGEGQGASLKAFFSATSFVCPWLSPDAFAISSIEEQGQEVGGPKISQGAPLYFPLGIGCKEGRSL